MSTIFFCQEQGSGLGHTMQMLPLARGLVEHGHRVFVALRDADGAEAVFAGSGVCYLDAPRRNETSPRARRPTFPVTGSFAHVLANVGWDNTRTLFTLGNMWQNLFAGFRPDGLVCDHSPSALLAARGLPKRVPRILLGSGFCCPPDSFPLGVFPGKRDAEQLAEDERCILGRANYLLRHWGQPPLERLGQLYSQVDENFLTTFPELEQYPRRTGARYWGPVIGAGGGKAPQWPDAPGPRVFAYLKPFSGLPQVLGLLNEKALPGVVYIDGLDRGMREQFQSPTLRLESQRLDLGRAAAECDLAILHAGQGSTAQVLLEGKPILQLPLVLEQQLTARAVARLGAGEMASAKDPESIRQKLDALLASDRYAAAARTFAAKYGDFDPAAQVEGMVGRVEELLEGSKRAALAPKPARGLGVPAGVFRA